MAKIRSNEAWQEIFAEYEASAESARDFCARHGLRLTYFYRRSLELRGRSASRRGQEVKRGAPPAAFVVQADKFSGHPTVTVCLLASAERDVPLFRLDVTPTSENGLRVPLQIQVDRLLT